MNNTEKKVSKITIVFIAVVSIVTLIFNSRISNNGIFITYAPFIMSSVLILVFLAIPFFLIIIFKYGMVLIDNYIDGIFSGKKFTVTSNNFYCQVCKSVVEPDDIYCSHCGMTM